MRSYLPYFASPLSCHPWLVRFSCSALSGLPSARVRHKGANPRYPDFRPRSVSTAYWPCLLLQPFATTMALTPAPRHPGLQVSPLISLHLPSIPPPATLCAPVSLYTPSPAYRTYFGLRLERRGSSPHTAESSSSSCGLPVRLQLLSTPPRGDAVTFGYRVLAYPDTDFHCADVAPSRAHSPALRAPPLCRCAERTADLVLQSRWNAAHQNPPPERKGSEQKGSGLVLQYRNARPDPRPLGTRWWSSAGKSGPRPPEHQKPSVAAGAARRGRFLERRGAQPEGRCAQRTSSSFWPRLSERRERSERSEFCGPTLGRAPQGSRRVQRPTAPV